jgi:hypothetical protein
MLPGMAISLIALVVIFYFIDFAKLLAALRQANYGLLALGICGTLGWLVARTMAWRALLGDLPRPLDVFFAINEGYLLSNLLPFRLGEVGRAFLLGRKALPTLVEPVETGLVEPVETGLVEPVETTHLGFWRTMSSVVVERVFDLAFGVSVLLISLPFVINVPWAQTAAQSTAVLVIIGLVMLYLMGRNPGWVMELFERLTVRWSFANKLGKGVLPRLLEGLAVFTDWKRFVRVAAWMTLNWALGLAIYWLYLAAFMPNPPLLWASFALGVAAVGGSIPSSPGNVGVLEGAIIAALTVFGVDPTIAFAYAISIHIVQVVITAAFGIYGLGREGETLLGVYQQLRRRSLTSDQHL